ncbi:DUF6641 family protein [Thalassotalea euphylliae]|uniref:Uncharacterized protein n=1 Tax=Thalassotalea euphylliae TaxID=1655234 RepID=A0A3E0UCG8_9GAMM|nr:DUF6641 family protein [Thalassotalea euphylliae]REL34688.1 hypothetical protein DXX92_04575 [Thalassotalea euphylliae]
MTKTNPLQALSFIAKPKVEAFSPIEVKRNKLITRLNEQRAMVQCLLENTDFVAYKEVFITDDESGEKRKVKRPKRVRPWFYQSADKYYFEIKYGTKSLEIQKTKPTIDVGSKDELLTVIDTIIDATKQGFLDAELAKVKGPKKQ